MSDGSLIKLHYHDNKSVLDDISDNNGKLYYKNAPIFIDVSPDVKNAIQTLADGIFVDGSYFLNKTQYELLIKFKKSGGNLYFEDRVVSQEYTESEIYIAYVKLWEQLNSEYPDIIPDSKTFVDSSGNKFLTSDDNIFTVRNGVK